MLRILFVSTYPPQECGIATYTRALVRGIEEQYGAATCMIAVPENGTRPVGTNDKIAYVIEGGGQYSYAKAAHWINNSSCDVVWLQHEFGLFGGPQGKDVLTLCRHLRKPLITTLHTVMQDPPPAAREITRQIVQMSSAVTVMARTGLEILKKKYKVNPEKPRMVPHGAPDVPFVPSGDAHKGEHDGRTILSTFGLISRGKGLEYAISSLPPIVAEFPNVKYLVLGQTHPKVVMEEGESYRESLVKLAEELGVSEHVEFVNSYLGLRQLLGYLNLTDVYVTPYIGKEQIVSGTLAYAVDCGKAIVSTPYLYAQEVLANGRGLLVDFRDSSGTAQAILELLRNNALKEGVEARCYAFSRDMTWQQVGSKHVRLARSFAPAREAALTKAQLASFSVSRATPSRAS